MGILSAEMDVALPYPELRWWVLGGVLVILLVGGVAIYRAVRGRTRSAEGGRNPGRR